MRAGDLQAVREAGVEPKEVALLELIDTLTRHAHRITDEQVQGLRGVGWSDEQIFEGVWVGCAFAYMTRMADAFNIRWTPAKVNPNSPGMQRMS